MNIGMICSSGGSVFSSAYQILKKCNYEFTVAVVTDRPCEVESFCIAEKLRFRRIEESISENFSAKAAYYLFEECNVSWVSVFFSRLIHEALYSHAPCVNFHPSLLPSYPGFGAIKKAHQAHEKYIGATAHFIDKSIDGGPILAQINTLTTGIQSLAEFERVSFAHKLYLFLIIFEWALEGKLQCKFNAINLKKDISNMRLVSTIGPRLKNIELDKAFFNFIRKEKIPWSA